MLDRITAIVMVLVGVLGATGIGALAAAMADSPPFGLAVALATITALGIILSLGTDE